MLDIFQGSQRGEEGESRQDRLPLAERDADCNSRCELAEPRRHRRVLGARFELAAYRRAGLSATAVSPPPLRLGGQSGEHGTRPRLQVKGGGAGQCASVSSAESLKKSGKHAEAREK